MVTQQELNAARREDEAMNREIAGRARKNGMQCVVDQRAFYNAVRSEGREILTHEGREYWQHQKRLYPHLRGGRSFNETAPGHRNHWGKVTRRWRGGVWWRREGAEWVREGERVIGDR